MKANQVKGNYVLILNLPFFEKSVDGGNDNPIWRSYVMDVTTMQGNVYDFRVFAEQDLYYNIEDNLIYDTSSIRLLLLLLVDLDILNLELILIMIFLFWI